jgi:hypothetical protein
LNTAECGCLIISREGCHLKPHQNGTKRGEAAFDGQNTARESTGYFNEGTAHL